MATEDFASCRTDARTLLESTGTPFTIATYVPREVLFVQGATSDRVMYIEKGRVWLAVTAPNGKQAICGLLGAGAFLGEEELTGRVARRHTATALAATEVLVVAKVHMMQLLRTQHTMSDLFIAHILTRNSRLSADLIDQILHTSEQRLMRALLALAGGEDRRPRRCVLPDVPQEIIAEMIGTTRSRVNVLMGKFKKLGFIEDDGSVLHVNPSFLDRPAEVFQTEQPRRRAGAKV